MPIKKRQEFKPKVVPIRPDEQPAKGPSIPYVFDDEEIVVIHDSHKDKPFNRTSFSRHMSAFHLADMQTTNMIEYCLWLKKWQAAFVVKLDRQGNLYVKSNIRELWFNGLVRL